LFAMQMYLKTGRQKLLYLVQTQFSQLRQLFNSLKQLENTLELDLREQTDTADITSTRTM
jgi:hypothetical protein